MGEPRTGASPQLPFSHGKWFAVDAVYDSLNGNRHTNHCYPTSELIVIPGSW